MLTTAADASGLMTLRGSARSKLMASPAAVVAEAEDGSKKTFQVVSRLDTPIDVKYYENGGILHTVLRDLISH